jgi:hypothetical protein
LHELGDFLAGRDQQSQQNEEGSSIARKEIRLKDYENSSVSQYI